MTNKNQNFLTTTDIEVSEMLKKAGFFLMTESNGLFVFANNSTINFTENVLSKIHFTNKINM